MGRMCRSFLRTVFAAGLFRLAAAGACAAVDVYPGPDLSLQSGRYAVQVTQDGRTAGSFVYESTNPFLWVHQPMGASNHWTTFSFDGTVEVTVTVPVSVRPRTVRILPVAFGLAAEISGQRIRFVLDRPRQLAVIVNDDRANPLFVFAKERERDLPDFTAANVIDFSRAPARPNDPDRPNVLYFPPGGYDLTALGHSLHDGFPLDAGDTVYLAGGAVVYGTFSARGPGVTVRGRGLISGAKWMWVRKRYEDAGLPWKFHEYREVAVYLHGGGRNVVEGITFTDPVHFCLSVDDDSVVRGVQCFGWWYTTDGVYAGARSVVEDCFFKVNDDHVKVYASDLQVRRCLFWQQSNGAPFQFTWNLRRPVRGVRVADCIVMASEVASDRALAGNRAVINSRLNQGAAITDFVFERLRIEGDIRCLLGLNIGEAGSISGVTLRDSEVTGRITHPNYLNATGGRIDTIRLENLRVAGRRIQSVAEFNLERVGEVGGVTVE